MAVTSDAIMPQALLAQFYNNGAFMDKIRNGDSVIYKDQVGTIYGKPRENKFKGTLYTIKVGEEYFKVTQSEIMLNKQEEAVNTLLVR